ncbi:hypothetical protein KWH75_06865 [Morganella morganii]|uniref:hypothetical protein n=1 Tax=Morganella morganii TaxID=582 RepID=UPI0021D29266|nr:hypothetical protein [Morganella morganii]MCU6236789.1 hypothetical protein [Morganella morganii]
MSIGKIVLDDDLLCHYLAGKKTKKYKNLMKKYIFPHATNFKQLSKVITENKELNKQNQFGSLLSQMANESYNNDDLELLASKTTFKIILTTDKEKKFPFIHYENYSVNNRLTFNLSPTDSRTILTKYLQELCCEAKRVVICDNYFASNWVHTESLFLSILPRKNLNIEYAETMPQTSTTLNSQFITPGYVSSVWPGWAVSSTTELKYLNCHDRYLLIESSSGRIEVMLSSGFSHIWHPTPKEITCVFNEIQ